MFDGLNAKNSIVLSLLDVYEFVHRDIITNASNKMQVYRLIYRS